MTGDLRERLGYTFRRPDLLAQALTHRSHGARHNERLEFVGDAVLNCVVAHALYERFPDIDEGDLSRVRASLVNRDTLAEIARRLGLARRSSSARASSGAGDRIGRRSSPTRWRRCTAPCSSTAASRPRATSSTARSATCCAMPIRRCSARIRRRGCRNGCRARHLPVPDYRIVEVSGEAHAQRFTAECSIPALGVATQGTGNSRRTAEQAAAASAYAIASTGERGRPGR